MRTCLNSRAAQPCIDSWDMTGAVSVVANSLAAHASAFANMACARAPPGLGSVSRQHGELVMSLC